MISYTFNTHTVFLFSLIFLLALLPFFVQQYSLALIIYSTFVYIIGIKYSKKLLIVSKKFLIILFMFIIYLLLTIAIHNNFLNYKAYLSFIILLLVFGAAYIVAYVIKNEKTSVLYSAIQNIFIFLVASGIIHIIFIGGAHNIFPFQEASHYALFTGPFGIALFVLSKSKLSKILIVSWLFFAGIAFPNTTILIYILLIGLLYFKLNFKNILLSFIGLTLMVLLILNNKYFYQRIFFWGNTSSNNLSALVYLQGIQDAYYSLISTKGIGLGFQQLGTQKESEASLLIKHILKNDIGLNRQDGGFTAAKIIAELGYLGITFLLYFFVLFRKAYRYLSDANKFHFYNKKLIICYTFIYSYIVELFIRGAGYFSPGSFLLYVSLAYLFVAKR